MCIILFCEILHVTEEMQVLEKASRVEALPEALFCCLSFSLACPVFSFLLSSRLGREV